MFDPSVIQRDLSALPVNHRVLFCASCSQRLLASYDKFAQAERWGSPDALKQAIDTVWLLLLGRGDLREDLIRDLTRRCEEAAPDTERFHSLYTSAALDAASATVETLRCCVDGDPNHGVNAGASARDAVDMYIQMRDALDAGGDGMEEAIARDPLMKRELTKQDKDLSDLKQAKTLSRDLVTLLRESSSYDLLA
jgi:uncharacterized protein YjaG (DUF416 family)